MTTNPESLSLEIAAKRLRAAVKDGGSHPDYHFAVMERQRRDWPVLWARIDELIALLASSEGK